jgi:hypothetical protein
MWEAQPVARKLHPPDSLPVREELEALVHFSLHLHNEVERTRPNSSVRRKLEDRQLDVRERFDRLLDEWVQDDEVRERWREHLHAHGPAPSDPKGIAPLVFRGENDAGSVVEVRPHGNELRVFVDGSLLERVEAQKDLASRVPGLIFHTDGFEFRETFAAPEEALRALAAFLEGGEQPPWDQVSDLLADGLVDVHLGLTPRGRRALGS